jgi:hypothetical protein
MVYLALFGSGYLLMGAQTKGIILLVAAIISAALLYGNLSRSGWETKAT